MGWTLRETLSTYSFTQVAPPAKQMSLCTMTSYFTSQCLMPLRRLQVVARQLLALFLQHSPPQFQQGARQDITAEMAVQMVSVHI